eukprot:5362225-Alexandrium_andersonii.AAC.1
MQAPVQHVKPILHQCAMRGLVQQAVQAREPMRGNGEVDWAVTFGGLKGLEAGKALLVRRIFGLGTWTQR